MSDSTLKIVEGKALSAQQKKDLLNRLARIEGQLRGVQKLIALAAQPSDVDAVAQQMAARAQLEQMRRALPGGMQGGPGMPGMPGRPGFPDGPESGDDAGHQTGQYL